MKIRKGFVSNSSSSSFVVYFPDNFDVKGYVKTIKEETLNKVFDDYELYEQYFEHMCEEEELDKREVLENSINNLLNNGVINYNDDGENLDYYILQYTIDDFIIACLNAQQEQEEIRLIRPIDFTKINEKYEN